jgi:hypothetical protein
VRLVAYSGLGGVFSLDVRLFWAESREKKWWAGASAQTVVGLVRTHA